MDGENIKKLKVKIEDGRKVPWEPSLIKVNCQKLKPLMSLNCFQKDYKMQKQR